LWFKGSGENCSIRPFLKKPFTKIRLVEWLKVKTLSSSPSTANKTKQNKIFFALT
jgi:hypothetical protein